MAEWVTITTTHAIAAGECKGFNINNTPIAIINHHGEWFAFEDDCTHAGFPLSEGCVENTAVVCPLHGAKFCFKTGAVLEGPAYEALITYPVRVVGDEIQVEI